MKITNLTPYIVPMGPLELIVILNGKPGLGYSLDENWLRAHDTPGS